MGGCSPRCSVSALGPSLPLPSFPSRKTSLGCVSPASAGMSTPPGLRCEFGCPSQAGVAGTALGRANLPPPTPWVPSWETAAAGPFPRNGESLPRGEDSGRVPVLKPMSVFFLYPGQHRAKCVHNPPCKVVIPLYAGAWPGGDTPRPFGCWWEL